MQFSRHPKAFVWHFALSIVAVSQTGIATAQDCVMPELVSGPAPTGQARELWLDGDMAYIAAGANGMIIYDVSDVSSPVLLSTTTNPGGSVDVTVVGTMAYLAASHNLRIFDVSDPSVPQLLGLTTFGCTSVVSNSDVVYVGPRLTVVDARDPANPVQVFINNVVNVSSWVISGDRLFGAGDNFYIFDLEDPLQPVLIGQYDTSGTASNLSVVGNIAYVANKIFGVRILDFTDLNNIIEIGYFRPTQDVYDVAVNGDTMYAGVEFSGFYSVDISDPASPVVLGRFLESSGSNLDTNGVKVRGDLVYTATNHRGLKIVDVSNHCDECLADTNNDGFINNADFTTWISAFNAGSSVCDQNGDGSCTPTDFTAWINNFNAGCP